MEDIEQKGIKDDDKSGVITDKNLKNNSKVIIGDKKCCS